MDGDEDGAGKEKTENVPDDPGKIEPSPVEGAKRDEGGMAMDNPTGSPSGDHEGDDGNDDKEEEISIDDSSEDEKAKTEAVKKKRKKKNKEKSVSKSKKEKKKERKKNRELKVQEKARGKIQEESSGQSINHPEDKEGERDLKRQKPGNSGELTKEKTDGYPGISKEGLHMLVSSFDAGTGSHIEKDKRWKGATKTKSTMDISGAENSSGKMTIEVDDLQLKAKSSEEKLSQKERDGLPHQDFIHVLLKANAHVISNEPSIVTPDTSSVSIESPVAMQDDLPPQDFIHVLPKADAHAISNEPSIATPDTSNASHESPAAMQGAGSSELPQNTDTGEIGISEDWEKECSNIQSKSSEETMKVDQTMEQQEYNDGQGVGTVNTGPNYEDPNNAGQSQSYFGKVWTGAKSLLGIPQKKEKANNVYLDVQQPASSVWFCIFDKFQNKYTEGYPMESIDKHNVYWSINARCLPNKRYMFYFVVYIGNREFSDFHHMIKEHQNMDGKRSIYFVFRYDNYNNNYISGRFWFAKRVYSRLCDGELTLKDALDEYDQIGFGYKNFAFRERYNVAKWIETELIRSGIKSDGVLFFAHVIQHFDWRLTRDDKKNKPLLKDLVKNCDCIAVLFDVVRAYSISDLTPIINNVEYLIASLLCHVQQGKSLEMLISFVLCFGLSLFEKLSDREIFFSENDMLFLRSHEGCTFIKDHEDDKVRNRVFGFVLKRTTSPIALYTFYEILNDMCPSYATSSADGFKKAFQKQLTSTHKYILDKDIWQAIPLKLKSGFLGMYVDALKRATKDILTIGEQQSEAIKVFFTDEISLQNDIVKNAFLDIFKNPTLSPVISTILRDSTFKASCWNDAPVDFKKAVYESVLSFAPQSQKHDNHIARAFHDLEKVFYALDVCPFEGIKDSAIQKCLDKISTFDLVTVVDAFESTQALHNDALEEYYSALQRSIEREIGRGHPYNDVLKMLEKLSNDKDTSKIERITKEVLRCISCDLKLPNGFPDAETLEFTKAFGGILKNHRLWNALFSVWPPNQSVEEFDQMVLLRGILIQLVQALRSKTIKVGDLEDLVQRDVNILQEMYSIVCDGGATNQNVVVDLIRCSHERATAVYEKIQKLVCHVKFIKDITDEEIDVLDIDDILENLNGKKKDFKIHHLYEVVDSDYLSCAKVFEDRHEDLENLTRYTMFRNAARRRLSEMSDRDYMSYEVLRITIDGGLRYLKTLCVPLFEYVGFMTIDDADELLSGVDEKSLESELRFVKQSVPTKAMLPEAKTFLLRFLKFPQMQSNLKSLNQLLESVDLRFDKSVSDFFTKNKNDYEDLQKLYDATNQVIGIESAVHGARGEVIRELADSKELINLLQETADDDVRNLIDAVEEHSDSTVRAKEVSDFIEIHKYFAPVFQCEPTHFFTTLKERLETLSDSQASGIAARIKESSNNAFSLRNIYKNVANRGEMTKEIVAAALQRGKFEITNKKNGSFADDASRICWEYRLTYSDSTTDTALNVGKTVSHTSEKLQDIKSRALLIVNSEKKQTSSEERDVDFQRFIDQIDLLNDIVLTGEELQMSGNPKYEQFWHTCCSLEDVRAVFRELNHEREEWRDTVRKARNTQHYLNFFHPNQLWTLKEFFNGNQKTNQEALSLLRFVDSSLTTEDLKGFKNDQAIEDGNDYFSQLTQIGSTLKRFFRSFKEKSQESAISKPHQQFSVAILDKESSQTSAIVMQLFKGSSLQSNKVLFCHETTTWVEIELFLRRCFTIDNGSAIHCLANVESLNMDLQFLLIDAIRDFQANGSQYWLVIICRGGRSHHIVNQFQENARKVPGMTEYELKKEFETRFPNVSLMTSDLPGLGKTERIWKKAAEQGRRLVSFPINGPFDRQKLVHRLTNLRLDEQCFLHIDVSEVNDPLLVDTFLFELIVLGMVSSSTMMFHLPTHHISIEVANTLQHHLRDSLAITKCFQRIHAKWDDDFQNFVCSQENESAVQVVCQYLSAHEKRGLEKERLSCKDLKEASPISESECRRLLKKNSPWNDISFNTVEIFVNVLASQLRCFSSSPFFRPENLTAAVKETADIRQRLFEALKDVSTEFAKRSVDACKEVQTFALWQQLLNPSSDDAATRMVNRVKGMVRWAEDNHLVVMFQEAYSISALFRELGKVPSQVQELFKSQNAPLKDLGRLDEHELEQKLKKILIVESKNETSDAQGYVLTPDNVLKMVLIVQRIRARVPVIVMGETGCGKTSLVRYLAKCCNAEFSVMNFHAGIYEEDIIEFTETQIKKAEKNIDKKIWVFFDEINTCDYLGLINDIICHRSLNGNELPPNIVFLAACNPYCLRSRDCITTAGLSGKCLTDEYSNLVYRVKPLPETMMDYVWDYGSLDPKDEQAYISRMVEKLETGSPDLVVDLLATSQEFIRDKQSRYSVSLRDVRRCILLVDWFKQMLKKRPKIDEKKLSGAVRKIYQDVQRYSIDDRSIILALAHSYQSRIPSSEQRKEFRKRLETVYRRHGEISISGDVFENVVRAEQEEILARMNLPDGTAKNTALRENVFVILVCILNRIPVFVVGKPGCSKSLSMQVIISNLRGQDSKDDFFKTLPQLLVVSYQGSESSTSEGILKVFDKAQQYKEQNKDNESLPVVLLDEVGLAEISKYNPLKVLHRLLEPEEKELPDVAVVGISNWALDAAKMNRAIHLSRPEPTLNDLEETGKSILEAQTKDDTSNSNVLDEHALQGGLDDDTLGCLASSYFEYQQNQIQTNFHGLRDYYSLIKCVSQMTMKTQSSSLQAESTCRSLQRNFGGLPKADREIEDSYIAQVKSMRLHHDMDNWQYFPVTELIADNLKDQTARHLMLITSGESSLGIIEDALSNVAKEKVIIYGSKFEEDQSEEYSYRTLSRIILYMERECVLVLRDLENVYGSLYDMLNQNYVEVGRKKNCRVALGPYSNPMCQVNDAFRCIVLVDENKVDYTDPPFLNRFEKQLLKHTDVLNDQELKVISQLQTWVKNFCTVDGQDFKERDVFLGIQEDTLASLVLLLGRQKDENVDLLRKCKEKLLDLATPDGVLRSLRSKQYKDDPQEVKALFELYFNEKHLHKGLRGFMKFFRKGRGAQINSHNKSLKYFVMTHSSIHTDVARSLMLSNPSQLQVEKLGAFKSERQLSKTIQQFWHDSAKKRLVFQCKPDLDADHMLLMRSTLEQNHEDYLLRCRKEGRTPTKSVCIIVHLERGHHTGTSQAWQFCFLNNWNQATIDALEIPEVTVTDILGYSVPLLMKEEILSLEKIIKDKLMWCFTRLKYPTTAQSMPANVKDQVESLKSNKLMMRYLQKIVFSWLVKHHDIQDDKYVGSGVKACEWQLDVACDKNALLGSSSLSSALLQYIGNVVRRPLAKAIFLIEDRLSFECCRRVLRQGKGKNDEQRFLAGLITDGEYFDIEDIPDPQEANCYVLTKPGLVNELNFPFSLIFNGKVETLRAIYISKSKDLDKDELFFQELHEDIHNTIPKLFQNGWLNRNLEKYTEDVFDYITSKYSSELSRDERLQIVKAACAGNLKKFPNAEPEIVLAQIYFFLWKNESDLLSILQLFICCKSIFCDKLNHFTRSYIRHFKGAVEIPTLGQIFEASSLQDENSRNDIDEESDTDSSGTESSEDEESDEDSSGSDDVTDDDDEDDGDEDDDESSSDASENDDDASPELQSDGKNYQQNVENLRKDHVSDNEISQESGDHRLQENIETPFLTYFFGALCERLLPTEQLIASVEGAKNWQRMVNSFISLVAKSEINETLLYIYLRICSDFTSMVLEPNSLNDPSSLYLLTELYYRNNKPGDLQNCFPELLDVIDGMGNQSTDVERFRISFLSRCLQGCNSEGFFQNIASNVSIFIGKQASQMASPLICDIARYTLYMLHIEGYDVSYIAFLHGEANDSSFLQMLDSALSDATRRSKGVTDCHFVTVFADAFSKIMPGDVDILEVTNSDSDVIACLKLATAIVKEPRRHQSIFMLVTAISYLRSILSSLAELVNENSAILNGESEYSNFLGYLNSIFEIPSGDQTMSPRKASALLYFLKELKQYFSMFELRKLCSGASRLPILTSLNWTDKTSETPFLILRETPLKISVKKALRDLVSSEESDQIQALCRSLPSDPTLRKVFAGVLTEELFLPHTQGDSVDRARDTIAHLLPRSLAGPYYHFILCLIGKQDLIGLSVSPGQTIQASRHLTIVLHLLIILTAQVEAKQIIDRPFFSYLLDPSQGSKSLVLAASDTGNQERERSCQILTCKCGTAFVRNDGEGCCPQHRKLCSRTPVCVEFKERDVTSEGPLCVANSTDDEFSVCEMNPTSYRLLHMFVHSALHGGVSLERFSERRLAQFLTVTDNALQCCMEEIENDLRVLGRLWNHNEERMLSIVHQVMEDLSGFIVKHIGSPSLTLESRTTLQRDFTRQVKIEQLVLQLRHNKDLTSLEAQIMEEDDTHSFEVLKRNEWLPRLFRSTKEESLGDFCSKYYSSMDAKTSYPLIGLFLKNLNILPLMSHLYQLVKFSNMLEEQFGRRLSRQDAREFIGDIIKDDNSGELKEALHSFCKSWEVVRPEVKRELGTEVPHLSETSLGSYFVVDQGEEGKYLQGAIGILQGLQNDFLAQVLHIANGGYCQALDFLRTTDSSCTIPIVHVQDVEQDEVIDFEWDDSILLHSHHNTDYGKGTQICYDFEKVERELVGRYLLNKVYLDSSQGLRGFSYSNELFHTSTNVLNEVCHQIPQQPITAILENRLNIIKDKKLESIRVLLENLEVIICSLVKTSRLDSNMSLVDYVKRNLSKSKLLPQTLFQDRQKEFKVCHVVAMYQKLEEMFSALAAENVADKYRNKLSESNIEFLKKVVDQLGDENIAKLSVVLTTLRRFIFRYLLATEEVHWFQDPHRVVVSQLEDPSLWPLSMASISEDDDDDETQPLFKELLYNFVPPSMRAGEIFSVMTYYDGHIKERQRIKERAKKTASKKSRPKMAPSFKSRFA